METTPESKHSEPKPASAPVMDVVPPKLAEAPKDTPKDVSKDAPKSSSKDTPKDDPALALDVDEKKRPKPAKVAVTRPPKQPGSGVGLAIFATIIIVLGLGALLVYAYLRTNNISVY